MHTEFVHYFASLRLPQQVRWALAGCFAFAAVKLYRISGTLTPQGHPAKRYIAARVEATERTVIPSLCVGLRPWVRRLGQGAALAALAVILALTLVGAAHTGHHIKHRHDANVHAIDVLK